MERMEVDQCAGAAAGGGGGALRRSNSAPMISGVSDAMTVFSPTSAARFRRSSVSVNHSCAGRALPLSPFSLASERLDHKRLEESVEQHLRENLQRMSASSPAPHPPVSHWHDHISLGIHSLDSGVTPNSSPSPTRRFRGAAVSDAVRWPALTPLKRKGGVESDGPPKKLFVAGVTDAPHITGYTVSVAQATGSPVGGVSEGSPFPLSPPPSFASHHPSF
ncbi:P2R1A-PPP2R2A-interacting phosphatase regulator 1 isoform X2 [Conger conger]|uniref:P2R1A-PPP2R2A-interacting phosphatase regulator 1 isoform X2 n=1 Tax=Conger conger TaxID=82655 RepID=UPI002A5B0DEE|nr:P2R1A-PPP2R2A-interacting phosphatase regulator 1 isoform X2 [Conger conger]